MEVSWTEASRDSIKAARMEKAEQTKKKEETRLYSFERLKSATFRGGIQCKLKFVIQSWLNFEIRHSGHTGYVMSVSRERSLV